MRFLNDLSIITLYYLFKSMKLYCNQTALLSIDELRQRRKVVYHKPVGVRREGE